MPNTDIYETPTFRVIPKERQENFFVALVAYEQHAANDSQISFENRARRIGEGGSYIRTIITSCSLC